MTTAQINNRYTVQIPQNWDDLKTNRKLFLWTVSLFFFNLTRSEILTMIVFRFLRFGGVMKKRISNAIENAPSSENTWHINSEITRVSEYLNFITDTTLEVNDNFFKYLFNRRKLYAPQSLLSNTEIWEFALCENDFFEYANSQKPEFLDNLISKLYRPKKNFMFFRKHFSDFDGDFRKEFNESHAQKRLNRISKLPIHYKWLIFRWFASQREIIVKAHPHTYKQSTDKKTNEDSNSSWADTIIAMSKVGEEDKTAKTKLSVFLRRIEKENAEAEKLKSKYKKNGRD